MVVNISNDFFSLLFSCELKTSTMYLVQKHLLVISMYVNRCM